MFTYLDEITILPQEGPSGIITLFQSSKVHKYSIQNAEIIQGDGSFSKYAILVN